ncbi:DUF1254 domain-containing protein [Variovorax sp. J22P271]|uniref:DUF1254 domain-containing protein n=1 Tax=Variovorax davisae TaxID=3053515 RepID=UPI0025765B10|nr:DUF1254 domain-containing protein [Variovorax sp. J22P271]MDM0037329.1 DUF1254 domain-containing protein [Variovorax sp. J22P271]
MTKTTACRRVVSLLGLLVGLASSMAIAQPAKPLSPAQAREVAKQAFLYAYPLVENYSSIYQLAIDTKSDQYKGPMNQISNVPRVFGPKDTSIVTPNSDTPYSYLIMDLRAEPLVVTMPPVEKDRYYSLQLVDLYSHNTDYLGTRRDGNGGGNYLIAGPVWKGKLPAGVKRIVRSDTALMFSQFRTQLKNPDDLEAVKKIQAGYKVVPLSTFTGSKPPDPAPAVDYPPITRAQIEPEVFRYANFLLRFCPPYADEKAIRQSFAAIGVAPGAPWPPRLPEPILQAIEQGRLDGVKALEASALKATSSKGLFGTHKELQGKYLERALGAKLGLYGNSSEEALYPVYQLDNGGQQLDSGKHDYRITFGKDQLPPVNAFWSVTMYDGKTRFLIDNPIDRYLVNTAMLPQFQRNDDGGITLYLQHTSPGTGKEANWLPAPNGPMYVVLRLYLPKPEVLSGRWSAPAIQEASAR